MYNFALAFVLCVAAYVIGEYVGTKTKAWIPSVFVTAIIFLLGYWTFFPTNLVSDSNLLPFGSTIGIYLLLCHMGSIISIKQLLAQWKTITVCLAGLVGMCLFAFIAMPLIGREYVIAGLPPLTGGIVAATMMQSAAQAKGLETAAIFAITMYCVQGFAGYPLTAVMLKKEGRRLLKDYRSGNITKAEQAVAADDGSRKTLIPPVPAKYNSVALVLGKLGICAWIATILGKVTGLSGAIWALLIGIILTSIGFLDRDALNKAHSYGIVMFALMMYVFDGLKNCTPSMLVSCILPMILLIVVGVVGMALFAFVIAKLLKMSFPMAFSTCLTALYGFPPNAIITEESCNALAQTPEEKEFLMNQMLPSMIVGGFTTVTITSVVIAGVFANLL